MKEIKDIVVVANFNVRKQAENLLTVTDYMQESNLDVELQHGNVATGLDDGSCMFNTLVIGRAGKRCKWRRKRLNIYALECGINYDHTDALPISFKYCPFCGGLIEYAQI